MVESTKGGTGSKVPTRTARRGMALAPAAGKQWEGSRIDLILAKVKTMLRGHRQRILCESTWRMAVIYKDPSRYN